MENFYSSHVFFFTFKWEVDDEGLTGNNPLASFGRIFENDLWIRSKDSYFPPKTIPHYNEVNFFYDFVWPSLYDNKSPNSFLYHYSINAPGKLTYSIETERIEPYLLEVDDILLHVYSTGVGVVSFHLYNREENQSDKEDVLKINEFGRRLYPAFYGTLGEKLGTNEFDSDEDWLRGLQSPMSAVLANRISIYNDKGKILAADDFMNYRKPGKVPGLIEGLLGQKLVESAKLRPVGDDRMFVLCWFGNKELVKNYSKSPEPAIFKLSFSPLFHYGSIYSGNSYLHLNDDWWYRYIFIDAGARTCQDPVMVRQLLEDHTNSRWVEWGTLFGASRYSFVALTSPLSEFSLVASHMRTMYYKIVELCIVQRASLLCFSDQVTAISSLEPAKGLTERVSMLYKKYIHFVNKVYFREITAQEQGIELYDLLSKHMRIERDVHNLDGEINELHEYAMLHEERNRTKSLELLTKLGAAFLVPTFIAGFLGMNVFDGNNVLKDSVLWIFGAMVLSTACLVAAITVRKNQMLSMVLLTLFLVILVMTLILIPLKIF